MLVRRNAIVVFMCIELMLNAVQPHVGRPSPASSGNLDGQVIAFFVMVVAAAEVVVGTRHHHDHLPVPAGPLRVDDANLLKY